MCIRQILFTVPSNQRALFAFSSLLIKALAITATLFSLVSYLSLFSVLCSCNKIYLFGNSCSAFSSFLLLLLGALTHLSQYTLRLLERPSTVSSLCLFIGDLETITGQICEH